MQSICLDANLIVLLVAGLTDPAIVEKHKRLKAFSFGDFEMLRDLVARAPRIVVSPNTLTEASNLLAQHGEPERSALLRNLAYFITNIVEVYIYSEQASRRSEFVRLGLTDASLLDIASADVPLLTVDANLHNTAVTLDSQCSVNFNHIRFQV